MSSANTISPDITRVTSEMSQERLWRRILEMATIGGREDGGVNRQALTDKDGEGQQRLVAWAELRGFTCSRDPIGNLFVTMRGRDPDAAPVLTGSHLDSQPTGGKFDGAYGVLAGFELTETLVDLDITPERSIEVVAWMNEEGCRFQPGAMGSGVFSGSHELNRMLQRKDGDGIVLCDALQRVEEAIPVPPRKLLASIPVRYVEVHIEQGPILEASDASIGIVTGIQGIRRLSVEIRGREAHAGTTPRALRHDALLTAAQSMVDLAARFSEEDPDDLLRFTVGTLNVHPNATNTIPGLVKYLVDLRHPDDNRLGRAVDAIAQAVTSAAGRGRCASIVETISHVLPTTFAPEVIAELEQGARALGCSCRLLSSGAGHDAMHLAKRCPSAMVFVPCNGGVSHHPDEHARPEDLIEGARVAATAVLTSALAA